MPPEEDKVPSIREALEAASAPVEEEVVETPVVEEVVETPETPATEGSDAPSDAPAVDGEAPPLAEGTPAATDTPMAAEGTPEASPAAAESDPTAKPPGSWTPAAREHWRNTPKEVRSEVWRREREASRALTISADARRLQQDFERTMQPFLGFVAAENSTPMRAVENMMRTAATLRAGTAAQKVQLVAQTIKSFGIDLQALDSVLAGQQLPANPADEVSRQVQQALAPILHERQQSQMAAKQREQAEVTAELDRFASDPKNEFYNDVAPLMADLMEVASRNGQEMELTQAYQRAILIHEPVRRVIDTRKAREKAHQDTIKARAARGAASSITPSAEAQVVVPTGGNSLRADIEAAITQSKGR